MTIWKAKQATGLASTLALFAIVLGAGAGAYAQGFMVKPMKMELSARPGQTVESVLELRNTGADEAKTLDLKLVELTQSSDGNWLIVEPGAHVDTSNLPSCLKWIKLSADSVSVDPLKMAPVTVSLKLPANARGFYVAGLIAQVKTKPADRGVTVVVRFLIPILVETEGRPERQQIALTDPGMAFRKETPSQPAATIVSLGVDNDGRTYSRLKASVKVMHYTNSRWQPVSTADFREIGILPGVKLRLPVDLQRRLPSGKYKLTATLAVDGRRVQPLEKEIEFEGDPAVTKLAVDTALTLEPAAVFIAGAPGATRTSILKVENASDDAVNIEASTLTPAPLRGVALGPITGEQYSCAPWVEVSPAKFTLRAGGKQNIRIVTKMPKTDAMNADYYGLICLRATYTDGQGAGETTSLVCVEDKAVVPTPAATPAKMTLAAAQGSGYAIQARFANTGNTHFKPKCRAVLASGMGQTVAEIDLAGDEGIMLPLETRDFSGVLDFDKIEPGAYALKAILECGQGQGASEQIPIRVAIEEGQKVVTIVRQEVAASAPASTQPAGDGR